MDIRKFFKKPSGLGDKNPSSGSDTNLRACRPTSQSEIKITSNPDGKQDDQSSTNEATSMISDLGSLESGPKQPSLQQISTYTLWNTVAFIFGVLLSPVSLA